MRYLILLIIILTSSIYADLFIVDSGGGEDCTQIQPCLDSAYAAKDTGTADTVQIKQGVYAERLDLTSYQDIDSDDSFLFTAFPGHEHKGDSSTGVRIVLDTTFNYIPDVNWKIIWQDLIFIMPDSGGAIGFGAQTVDRYMIFTKNQSATGVIGSFGNFYNGVIVCDIDPAQSCITSSFLGLGSGGVINSVVRAISARRGIHGGHSSNSIVKIMAGNSSAACWINGHPTSERNICIKDGFASGADTTAPGTGSFTSTWAEVDFADTLTNDFHINASSVAFFKGVDRSAQFALDIDLESWTQWSMGFDQPATPPVNITFPNGGGDLLLCDTGRIITSGTYFEDGGDIDSLEWRYDGGPWTRIPHADSGTFGTWDDTVYTNRCDTTWFVIRQKPDTAKLDSQQLYIGDIWGWAGQSNAQGASSQRVNYTATNRDIFINSEERRKFEDPLNPGLALPIQPGSSTYSTLPYLASLIADQRPDSIPQIWVYYGKARGCVNNATVQGTEAWCPDTTAAAYDSMVTVFNNSGIDYLKALYFFQGETDATQGSPRDKYKLWKSNMIDSLRADIGSPDLIGFLGYIGYRVADSINPIRIVQQELGAEGINWKPTSPTYDVNYSVDAGFDGAHFGDSLQLKTQGQRVFRGPADYYGWSGNHGRGPILETVEVLNGQEILLTFNTVGFTPGAVNDTIFTVAVDSGDVVLDSAVVTNTTQIKIYTADILTGNIAVSIGKDNVGVDTDLLDIGTYPAPPEVVLNAVASVPSGKKPFLKGRAGLTKIRLH